MFDVFIIYLFIVKIIYSSVINLLHGSETQKVYKMLLASLLILRKKQGSFKITYQMLIKSSECLRYWGKLFQAVAVSTNAPYVDDLPYIVQGHSRSI